MFHSKFRAENKWTKKLVLSVICILVIIITIPGCKMLGRNNPDNFVKSRISFMVSLIDGQKIYTTAELIKEFSTFNKGASIENFISANSGQPDKIRQGLREFAIAFFGNEVSPNISASDFKIVAKTKIKVYGKQCYLYAIQNTNPPSEELTGYFCVVVKEDNGEYNVDGWIPIDGKAKFESLVAKIKKGAFTVPPQSL